MPNENIVTIEEFYRLRESTDKLLEYIDGVVFMSLSPSTKHQRILGRLHAQLFNFLEEKDCEVFHAPFDVELKKENRKGQKLSFLIYL